MKKFIFFFLSLGILGSAFYSCDNSKTYAEKLADERKVINKFLSDNKITVISEEEFLKDTLTDVSRNEYVYFDNGVYMQIVSRGNEEVTDTFRNNDVVLVRFLEYSVMDADTVRGVSNYDTGYGKYPEGFRLLKTTSSISGLFLPEIRPEEYTMSTVYGTAVPNGWLVPLQYVRNNAHVKVIVPSKMGHDVSMQYVYPYFYEIKKYERY